MPEKTRRLILGIVGGTAIVALVAILVLTFGRNTDYSVLFSGLSQEEAQQIGSLLQDEQIDYRYNASDGTIRVPETVVETTRVTLLSQGYPKNGFAYDMYLDNTGLMTTESDKKQITLYELQDRLGATIRSFEGVQEARVNIAEATEQRYVLEDNEAQGASASVVITMQNGSTLTEDKAQAVKNLVAHSVRGMNFAEVVVLDGETMLEVGGSSGSSTATDLTSLTSMVESNIAANIRNVLEKLYGTGSVAVSVKGTINMEKLIQESTQYSTPEKISDEDKTGLLEREELVNESSQAYAQGAGGVVGTDANADTPRYTNDDGTEEEADSYYDGSASREWLYNVIKEQRQVDPGILEDVSVGIIILTDNTTVPQADLYRLVANSAGIPVEDANDKITIIRDPGMQTETENPILNPPEDTLGVITTLIPLPILIAIVAGILLLFLLLLLLLLRRRRKKKESEPQDEDFAGGDQLSASDLGIDDTGAGPLVSGLDDEDDMNSEEIMNLRMQKSMRLKQNIAEFVDQNPQIAAKLVQSWLRGEEETDGRNRNSGRKHSK